MNKKGSHVCHESEDGLYLLPILESSTNVNRRVRISQQGKAPPPGFHICSKP